ncbi:MAG: InlB B-repeat-containing protein [Verrucomicrobia bacterium]|nr:InlB B-repeat-containing protein [Verrucomicrobiota bacterium]
MNTFAYRNLMLVLLVLATNWCAMPSASAASTAWTATGSMTIARDSYTATLLPNGKVLVAGGQYNSGSKLSSAELYDPATGAWTATGAMGTARGGHTATLLPNGKVLVAGGFNSTFLSSAELYDPATGTWTATGAMTTAREIHTATLLSNGKVLVARGYQRSSAELYDPTTGKWTATGAMITVRDYNTATLLPNGKVLVAGGQYNSSSSLSSAELYDPATGAWTVTGTMITARTLHTSALLPSGQVMVAGGANGSSVSSAELYDPATGAWTVTGIMITARSRHTATLLPSGKVLVAGGSNGSSLSSAELYDPATGAWTVTGAMGTTRFSPTATLLPNGKVLVAGGYHLSSAELYNIPSLMIILDAVADGQITGNDSPYFANSIATLTATASLGYIFTGWTGDATGSANPLSLLMDGDKTIGAIFMWQYTLTTSALSNGTISGSAVGGKYLTGTTPTLTAVPAAGYVFTGWTGDATGTANPLALLMDSDKTIGAIFTRQYTLTLGAVSNGTISGIAVGGKYLTGATATLTAVPAAGYAFTGWTGAASGTTNPLALLMNGDKTIGATFTRQYALTLGAVSNGTISGIAVDGKYLTGTTATLTAVPASGYVFTGWTGAASGTANPLSLLMNGDKTVGATFTRQYTLTSDLAVNGSLTGMTADGKYLTGTTATLTAVPAPGYAFTGWIGAASGTTNPLSLLMDADKTIGATFTRQYTLTTSTLSNGSITGIAAGGKYLTGTTATLTAVPAAGYAFTGWTGAASGTTNPLSLLMDADKTIGATFTRQYTLTASALSNGTISGIVAGGKYLTGTTATLTAVPAAGYVFTGWTGAASGTINPLSLLMNSDKTIGATYGGGIEVLVGGQVPAGSEVVERGTLMVTMQTAFANGTILYTLDGSAPSLGSKLYTKALTISRSCTVRAVAYSSDFASQMQSPPLAVVIVPTLTATTAGGGSVSVQPPDGSYASGSMATLTATPVAGWTFLQWLGDASGTDPVTSVQVSRNKCVQAVFGTAVNTTTVGSGTIRQDPVAAFYPYGTRVRCSGLPASGNYLAFWGNAVTSTDNPLDFQVTNPNPTVTAVFQPLGIGRFALALVADGGGKVAVTPAANRHNSGASVRLTAQPDVGQEFVGWSGDAAGSINPLTVAMTQNKAITAVFTKRPGLRIDTSPEGLVEDGCRLTLTGEFGKQYEILGSSDLVNWIQAGTLTNVYGTSQFTDGDATNLPRRFYRAAMLNP